MKGTPSSLDTLLWVYHYHSSTEVRLLRGPRKGRHLENFWGVPPTVTRRFLCPCSFSRWLSNPQFCLPWNSLWPQPTNICSRGSES